MKKINLGMILALFAIMALNLQIAMAHCDHVEGPVIKAAKTAISENDVDYILIWVQPADEARLTAIFNAALPDIKAGDTDAEVRFLEDLVRIHRSGEGASFEGIKPAGTEMEPIIVAADAAVETGSLAVLHPYVKDDLEKHAGVVQRFKRVMELKIYDPSNLTAGREYVDAYVDFMKFVEGEEAEEPEADNQASSKTSKNTLSWTLVGLLGITTVTLGTARILKKRSR